MNERTEDETIGPEGPEPAPSVREDVEPAVTEEDTGADAASTPAAPPARRGFAGVLAFLALLLALAAAAGVGWLAWSERGADAAADSNRNRIEAASDELDETRSAVEDLRSRIEELDAANEDRQERLEDVGERQDELRERIESVPERLSRLERTVSSLAGISTGARDAWVLAEAEYYMQIANAELQLAGNAEQALAALRFADERIRELADPALAGVRRALTEELRALDAMETPDIAGVTMTLSSLADSVGSLPLRQDIREQRTETGQPGIEASGLDRAIASVRSAFSGIVSVRRTDEEIEPLLSPEAAYFLRANLALELQAARLALLRGEQAIVEETLGEAAEWLREYYAADSRAVRSALETLGRISDADWSVTPPDISGSLRLLREYRERRRAESPEQEPDPESQREPTADEPAQ